ncbi:hypothetical protein HS125_09620 [bacterium]|nr:hypothetical protein [bacterium]
MKNESGLASEVLIYLLQNQARSPIDISLLAEDFSGARPNPLVGRDLLRGVSQDETAEHESMRQRLTRVLEELEERGLVELAGSLVVATRRARLTPSGRARAEVCLAERRKRAIR